MLDPELLAIRHRRPDGSLLARCPACAEVGRDARGEHLLVRPGGAFGCVANQGDREHNRRIFQLAGAKTAKDGPWVPARVFLPPHRPPLAFPPGWNSGSPAERIALARLRRLPLRAIERAAAAGVLRFGPYAPGDHPPVPCWIVGDFAAGRVAQARRLDGRPWFGDTKGLTLKGSPGAKWPVGLGPGTGPVLLVEGAPDLLAGWAVVDALEARRRVLAGRGGALTPVAAKNAVAGLPDAKAGHPPAAEWSVAAMLGSGMEPPPESFRFFRGREVWIVPHRDDAGLKGAKRWWRTLQPVASLHVVRLWNGQPPAGLKDLNDFVRTTGPSGWAALLG